MGDCPGPDEVARQLLERLPLDAMRRAADGALANLGDGLAVSLRTEHAVAALVVAEIVREISERDPDVVTLTELYQSACRELDAAGVPHADAPGPEMLMLDLAGRIRWLAQQRPTRLEVQRLQEDRDAQIELRATAERERDAARSELADLDEVLLSGGIARSLDRFQETPATLRKRVEHAVALAGLRKPGSD